MKILVLDLETTSKLESGCKITEIATVTWDYGIGRIISSNSYLVNYLSDGEVICKTVSDMTKLNADIIRKYGITQKEAITRLYREMLNADCVLARCGNLLDYPLIKMEMFKQDLDMPAIPLVDDSLDVIYPDYIKGKSLTHIAADVGIINPYPHIALGDALTFIKVLQKIKYDMNKAVESAVSPIVKVYADRGYKRDDMYPLGFWFDKETKKYSKTERESSYEKADYYFETSLEYLTGSPKPQGTLGI